MKRRRPCAIRRSPSGRSVTVNVLEVHRRAGNGTLSREDRAAYKSVFGCEPEELQQKYGKGSEPISGMPESASPKTEGEG